MTRKTWILSIAGAVLALGVLWLTVVRKALADSISGYLTVQLQNSGPLQVQTGEIPVRVSSGPGEGIPVRLLGLPQAPETPKLTVVPLSAAQGQPQRFVVVENDRWTVYQVTGADPVRIQKVIGPVAP